MNELRGAAGDVADDCIGRAHAWRKQLSVRLPARPPCQRLCWPFGWCLVGNGNGSQGLLQENVQGLVKW